MKRFMGKSDFAGCIHFGSYYYFWPPLEIGWYHLFAVLTVTIVYKTVEVKSIKIKKFSCKIRSSEIYSNILGGPASIGKLLYSYVFAFSADKRRREWRQCASLYVQCTVIAGISDLQTHDVETWKIFNIPTYKSANIYIKCMTTQMVVISSFHIIFPRYDMYTII